MLSRRHLQEEFFHSFALKERLNLPSYLLSPGHLAATRQSLSKTHLPRGFALKSKDFLPYQTNSHYLPLQPPNHSRCQNQDMLSPYQLPVAQNPLNFRPYLLFSQTADQQIFYPPLYLILRQKNSFDLIGNLYNHT